MIYCDLLLWRVSYLGNKVPRVLITPVGMPMWPLCANDHDTTHAQDKVVSLNLIWSESAQWLLSYSVHKVKKALIVPVGTLMWPRCANDHDVAHLQTKMFPINFIHNESAQWLLSYGCKVWAGWPAKQMETIPYSPFFTSERRGYTVTRLIFPIPSQYS